MNWLSSRSKSNLAALNGRWVNTHTGWFRTCPWNRCSPVRLYCVFSGQYCVSVCVPIGNQQQGVTRKQFINYFWNILQLFSYPVIPQLSPSWDFEIMNLGSSPVDTTAIPLVSCWKCRNSQQFLALHLVMFRFYSKTISETIINCWCSKPCIGYFQDVL